MLLSAAMMLDWLGARHQEARLSEAGRLLEDAVRSIFAADGVRPFEFGGSDGTHAIASAVQRRLG